MAALWRRSTRSFAGRSFGAKLVVEVVRISDELDDYQEVAERAEAREDEHERELALADAAQLDDINAEQDETRFDETRLIYSGVEEGDGDVDVQELEEAGAQLDDPDRDAPRTDR